VPELTLATATDVPDVVRLRDAAATWLLARGIDQWHPGEVSAGRLATRVAAGEVFVVRSGGRIAAAVVVTDADVRVWGPDDGDAGYVHTLVVDRAYAGTELGRTVLTGAESRIRAAGRVRGRLDCVSANPRLRAYYRDAGYAEVGHATFRADGDTTLFEKRLTP
jgi:protein-tyrosine phosphatase